MLTNTEGKNNELLFATFNQDNSCFTCGLTNGFFVCDTEPFRERFRREFDVGGISIVEILNRSNILALVGSGSNETYPRYKVMIWDDHQEKCIAELEFKSDVKAVKLRRDRIIVALETKVYVYDFETLILVEQFETSPNKNGILSVAPITNEVIYVTLAKGTGLVRIDRAKSEIDKNTHKQDTKTVEFKATESQIAQVALDHQGKRLAVTSQKGTIIRVYDVETQTLIDEFRRGSQTANIQCLAFSPDSTLLAVTSDHGTVHIFQIEGENKQSSLSSIVPFAFFQSKWSSAKFNLDPPETKSICAFVSNSSLVVLGASGTYTLYSIIREGSNIRVELDGQRNFLRESSVYDER